MRRRTNFTISHRRTDWAVKRKSKEKLKCRSDSRSMHVRVAYLFDVKWERWPSDSVWAERNLYEKCYMRVPVCLTTGNTKYDTYNIVWSRWNNLAANKCIKRLTFRIRMQMTTHDCLRQLPSCTLHRVNGLWREVGVIRRNGSFRFLVNVNHRWHYFIYEWQLVVCVVFMSNEKW